MKKLLLLLALAASAVGAAAQEAAPDPAKLALAHEAIAAMQMDKAINSMGTQIQQLAKQQLHLPATATPEQQKRADDYMAKVAELTLAEIQSLVTKMDAVYAEIYTDAELKAIITFFKSPEGASMQSKQPLILARVMPITQEMQRTLMPKLQQLTQEYQAANTPAPAATPPPAPATTP